MMMTVMMVVMMMGMMSRHKQHWPAEPFCFTNQKEFYMEHYTRTDGHHTNYTHCTLCTLYTSYTIHSDNNEFCCATFMFRQREFYMEFIFGPNLRRHERENRQQASSNGQNPLGPGFVFARIQTQIQIQTTKQIQIVQSTNTEQAISFCLSNGQNPLGFNIQFFCFLPKYKKK